MLFRIISGRGKILLENTRYALTIPPGKNKTRNYFTSFQVLVLKKHRHHMNITKTIPTLLFLTS